jgi:hypothetical protein
LLPKSSRSGGSSRFAMRMMRFVSICARNTASADVTNARAASNAAKAAVDSFGRLDEGDGANLTTVAFHEIAELHRATRRGNKLVALRKHSFG